MCMVIFFSIPAAVLFFPTQRIFFAELNKYLISLEEFLIQGKSNHFYLFSLFCIEKGFFVAFSGILNEPGLSESVRYTHSGKLERDISCMIQVMITELHYFNLFNSGLFRMKAVVLIRELEI